MELTTASCHPSFEACAEIVELEDARRDKAGELAYQMARRHGFCELLARDFEKRARRAVLQGERPEDCARRVVIHPKRSATVPEVG